MQNKKQKLIFLFFNQKIGKNGKKWKKYEKLKNKINNIFIDTNTHFRVFSVLSSFKK